MRNDLTEKPASESFPGRLRVWLAGGLLCPRCQRGLRAGDIFADFGSVTMICAGCHRDVLRIRGEE